MNSLEDVIGVVLGIAPQRMAQLSEMLWDAYERKFDALYPLIQGTSARLALGGAAGLPPTIEHLILSPGEKPPEDWAIFATEHEFIAFLACPPDPRIRQPKFDT